MAHYEALDRHTYVSVPWTHWNLDGEDVVAWLEFGLVGQGRRGREKTMRSQVYLRFLSWEWITVIQWEEHQNVRISQVRRKRDYKDVPGIVGGMRTARQEWCPRSEDGHRAVPGRGREVKDWKRTHGSLSVPGSARVKEGFILQFRQCYIQICILYAYIWIYL